MTSDTNDRLTYQHGSRTYERNLDGRYQRNLLQHERAGERSHSSPASGTSAVYSCVFLALTTALATVRGHDPRFAATPARNGYHRSISGHRLLGWIRCPDPQNHQTAAQPLGNCRPPLDRIGHLLHDRRRDGRSCYILGWPDYFGNLCSQPGPAPHQNEPAANPSRRPRAWAAWVASPRVQPKQKPCEKTVSLAADHSAKETAHLAKSESTDES